MSSQTKPRVVALSGWRGTGKSTVAKYLVQQHHYTCMGLADKLKKDVQAKYDLIWSDLHTQTGKARLLKQYPLSQSELGTLGIDNLVREELSRGFWTPRALMIFEAAIARTVYQNYWVNHLINSIHLTSTGEAVVIDDLRYKFEMSRLREHFGEQLITIRLNRFESIDTQDPSEHDLDGAEFDYILDTSELSANQVNHMVSYLLVDHSQS